MIGFYNDVPQKNNMRIAVVTTTHIGDFSYHHQQYPYEEKCAKIFEDIRFMWKCHKYYRDWTIPYDFYIVDNASTFQPLLDWLKNLRDVAVCHRENTGFSFAGWEYIWKMYGRKYDFYLFHEQDMIPAKKKWLEELLTAFYKNPGIGVVGNVLETKNEGERFNLSRKKLINNDGCYHFISSQVLEEVGMKLLYDRGNGAGVMNEVNCWQPLLEKGYKIKALAEPQRTYTYMSSGTCNNIYGEIKKTILPMISLHAIPNEPWLKSYFEGEGLV